jgi:hypothetical protein
MANKGRQGPSVLTVNGRITLLRRWDSGGAVGSVAPVDEYVDRRQATVSVGVREMACRLNDDGMSFDKTAADLHRTALVQVGGEPLRKLVRHEGQAVREAQRGPRSANPRTSRPPTDCCTTSASVAT